MDKTRQLMKERGHCPCPVCDVCGLGLQQREGMALDYFKVLKFCVIMISENFQFPKMLHLTLISTVRGKKGKFPETNLKSRAGR